MTVPDLANAVRVAKSGCWDSSAHYDVNPMPGGDLELMHSSLMQCDLRALFRNVLLVEDSLIIAMDAEDLVNELGGDKVTLATSVEEALTSIEFELPSFAILDVRLESETSFPVADKLLALQIPFVFATGYSDRDTFPVSHRSVPYMSKPYNLESLTSVIEDLFRSDDQLEIQPALHSG